jgi:uncharacterized protein (DUF4415 family)
MKRQVEKKENREDFELKAEYDFSKGVRGRFYRPTKLATSLRLDDDVIAYFKRLASEKKVGYQTLINSALRDYCQGH